MEQKISQIAVATVALATLPAFDPVLRLLPRPRPTQHGPFDWSTSISIALHVAETFWVMVSMLSSWIGAELISRDETERSLWGTIRTILEILSAMVEFDRQATSALDEKDAGQTKYPSNGCRELSTKPS